MGHGVGLVADKIIEPVGAVGVDEAVADPLACTNRFVDVGYDFECGFDAIFVCLTGLQGFDVIFAGESEDVKGFFTGKGDKLARLRPVDLSFRQSCS